MQKKSQKVSASKVSGVLSVKLTAHLKSLLKSLEQGDPDAFAALSRQFLLSDAEERILSDELADPLGEHLHTAAARLIHQYKNRCLLLATGRCLAHCRYCFRREYLAEEKNGFINGDELERACLYLENHPEVDEVLVSGGDVLCAADSEVERLLRRLRAVRPDLLLRLCTRANVALPSRFTRSLVSLLKSIRPLWVIPHINHPAELTEQSRASFCRLIDSGIPVQSQTVLLRGVNDSVAVLARLFTALVRLGVKPGYLFQADLARGTAHFRVPAEEGLRLYEELRQELSGLSLPVYALDLPGGGGKFNMLQLDPQILQQKAVRADTCYMVENHGKTWYYPRN